MWENQTIQFIGFEEIHNYITNGFVAPHSKFSKIDTLNNCIQKAHANFN